MGSAKVQPDFSIKLPEELRGRLAPGDEVEVVAKGKELALRIRSTGGPSMREIIERVRSNPLKPALSEAQIEKIVHEVRRKRK